MTSPLISRRNFLHTTALSAACFSTANAQQTKPSYTLAAHTSMFRKYRGEKLFTQIRNAGYTHVELNGGQIRQAANPANAKQLQQQLANANLKPAAAFVVHKIANPDEAERKKAVDQWRTSIEGINNLGLKRIGTELTGDIRNPNACEAAFRKSLDELLPRIQQADFHLSLEPHPGDFFEAAQPTIQLLKDYNSKRLGYLHCTPHTFYLGESISQVIAQAGPLLTHIHIADTFQTKRIMDRFGTGVGLHLHLTPGLGEVDFTETFTALNKINYQGLISIQLLSHNEDPDTAAKAARRYLNKQLGDRLKI